MIAKVGDDKCARCDESSDKCMPCECGTGSDCMPADKCEKECKPVGKRYKCDWKTTTCMEDPMGRMNQTECAEECKPAAYGKCDYENDKCVPCTPGADDRDCVYLMSYCTVAQKMKRCEEEILKGLFRMVEAQPGYDAGEFDVEFRANKMWI